MIQAELQAFKLQQALEAVNVLVDTATVEFGPEGIRVETVDPANVGAVSMTLLSPAFEQYNGGEAELHLDIQRFSRIIDEFAGDRLVHLSYENSANQLDLKVGSYNFDLSLIHPDSVQSADKAGEVNPPAQVVMEAGPFQKAMRMADMFSDEIILGVDAKRNVFYINAIGDNDSMAVSYDKSDEVIGEMESKPAHTIFGLSLISEMAKIAPNSSSLTLNLGKQYPIQMRFDIANSHGRVEYGLAPRIER
jgi:proliferating cell nuclear antigen